MKVELRKLSDVKPFPGNPRQNGAAVDAVAASIKEFGFRQLIVVDADGIIAARILKCPKRTANLPSSPV